MVGESLNEVRKFIGQDGVDAGEGTRSPLSALFPRSGFIKNVDKGERVPSPAAALHATYASAFLLQFPIFILSV